MAFWKKWTQEIWIGSKEEEEDDQDVGPAVHSAQQTKKKKKKPKQPKPEVVESSKSTLRHFPKLCSQITHLFFTIRTNLEGLLVAGSPPPRRLRRYINRDYWPYLADGTQLLPGRISRRPGQLRHADAQQVKIRLNNRTQYRREEEFHFKFDLIITRKFFVVFLLNPTKRIDPLYLDIYICEGAKGSAV